MRHIIKFLQQYSKDALRMEFGLVMNMGVGLLRLKDGSLRFSQNRKHAPSIISQSQADLLSQKVQQLPKTDRVSYTSALTTQI
jgi:hypothetical protein